MTPLNIFDFLLKNAKSKAASLPNQALKIRGVTRTSYVLKLGEDETVFHLHYVVVQTSGQGCCYYEPATIEVGLSTNDLGKNVLRIATGRDPIVAIAALDAVYCSIKSKPSKRFVLNGLNMDKAQKRAQIVSREALTLLRGKSPKNGKKFIVANVGVVGSILSELHNKTNLIVTASDYFVGVANKKVHGVKVHYGSNTPQLVAEADVAIVTGMTLANRTLDNILEVAKKNRTALVVFAETGANFASEYCKLGIDVVVSEPFPFYLTCHGQTIIDVYRRKGG